MARSGNKRLWSVDGAASIVGVSVAVGMVANEDILGLSATIEAIHQSSL